MQNLVVKTLLTLTFILFTAWKANHSRKTRGGKTISRRHPYKLSEHVSEDMFQNLYKDASEARQARVFQEQHQIELYEEVISSAYFEALLQ